MWIEKEAPQVFRLLQETRKIYMALEGFEGWEVALEMQDPESGLSKTVSELRAITDRLNVVIEDYHLQSDAVVRFVTAVEELLKNPNLLRSKVNILHSGAPPAQHHDWFDASYSWDGSLLDNNAYVTVLHPQLILEAKRRWGDDRRVCFPDIPRSDGGSYNDERVALLEKHGVPSDADIWMWAYEALFFAEQGLRKLNIKLRLCDYVEWTSDDEPPNMMAGATCSFPALFREAVFGHRLDAELPLTRIESCDIWKTPQATYVAPLWEYLSWSCNTYGDARIFAATLGDIGKGIDRATAICNRPDDPDGSENSRWTVTDIFRAGEALANLRTKLEFGEVFDKGLRAEAAAKDRAKRGGSKSSAARDARRGALLKALEAVAQRNQDFAEAVEILLPIAVKEAAAADPVLWAQGRKQAEEYLGEIRRGEAGEDMKARYRAIFPQ